MTITVRKVQDLVCSHFGISRDDLLNQNRSRELAWPRMIAMYLAREYTSASLMKLGQQFCRDHTCICNAVRAKASIEADMAWWPRISAIRTDLEDPSAADRRNYEIYMREKWRKSIPFHFTPEYGASLHGGIGEV